jgi:hypothetical protein
LAVVSLLVKVPAKAEDLTIPPGRYRGRSKTLTYGLLAERDSSETRYSIDVTAEEFVAMGGKGGRNSAGATIDLTKVVRQGLVEVEDD